MFKAIKLFLTKNNWKTYWSSSCKSNSYSPLWGEHGKVNTVVKFQYDEQKKKYRESNSGEGNPMFNKKHTKESIEKIRSAGLNRKHTEETKQTIWLFIIGRKHTKETKEKIRLAGIGNTNRCIKNKIDLNHKPL